MNLPPVAESSGATRWRALVDACRERALAAGVARDREALATIAGSLVDPDAPASHRAAMVAAAVAELSGFGVLEPLLARAGVTEVMVNGTDPIWIEVDGKLEQTAAHFADAAALRVVIERMVATSGRRVDESSPLVDARLDDGSRINAVLPPVSPVPLLTVRRFSGPLRTVNDLIASGSVRPHIARALRNAVAARANILVCGVAGSGKTTLLAALCSLVPAGQRLVLVEDVAELRIDHPNVAAQECRPGGCDGVAPIVMRDLVRNGLRMRPDRIIVGEVRGAEAVDMIQAMTTGHAGSMTSLHADSCADALVRLESLLALGLPGVDIAVIRRWMVAALDLVVHCTRSADGERRVGDVMAVAAGVDGSICVRRLESREDPQTPDAAA